MTTECTLDKQISYKKKKLHWNDADKNLIFSYKQRLGMEIGGEANVFIIHSKKEEPKDVRSHSNFLKEDRTEK